VSRGNPLPSGRGGGQAIAGPASAKHGCPDQETLDAIYREGPSFATFLAGMALA
jgi:hypothetical protein